VLGVVSVISHVSSLRTRGRQAEVMKRTVTISNARDTGPTVDVVLWGERATAFPAEQIHRDSRSSPQIIVFVGTLVRSYADNVSLSGGSSCKWYINAPLPEVNALRASAETNHNPVIWDQGKAAAESTVIAVPEHKKLKDIKYLHPFENKKKEWLVVVKILKIDRSCIGSPTPRYKISLTAEDDTDTAEFIFFGRMAQRLIKKMWTPSSRLIHPVSFQEKLQIYWKSLSSGINGWWQHASNYTVLIAVVDHTFSRLEHSLEHIRPLIFPAKRRKVVTMKKRKERVSSESTLPLVVGITAEESTALIPAASESKAQKVVAEDLTPVGRDALSRIRGRDFDSACGLTEDTGALIVWQAPPILEEMAAHNQLDSKQDPDSFRPPATSVIEYQRQGPTAQMTNISFMVGNSSHARPTDQDDENLRGDVLTLINELEDERAAALERTRILEERLQQELENERTVAAERTTILKSKEAAIERTRVLDENLE
ncbi:hypothetical protein ACJX0J_008580, partial [Zea mays]